MAAEERHAVVERWLETEVAPVYDALKEDPKRTRPAVDVFAAIRERHAAALKGDV